MSERFLLLSTLKIAAEKLFDAGRTFDAVFACSLLDELLDRRLVTNTDVRAIRELATLARETWR